MLIYESISHLLVTFVKVLLNTLHTNNKGDLRSFLEYFQNGTLFVYNCVNLIYGSDDITSLLAFLIYIVIMIRKKGPDFTF